MLRTLPCTVPMIRRHLQISRLLRPPYPAQALAIMGVAQRWQIARGAHVVAECGAGKTLIALGMMFVHAQGQPFSGIVMAPPHLVEKWARETFLTLALECGCS